MISRRRGGGNFFFEKCEDHYIKSHKKCEDGGIENCQKRCKIMFEWPLMQKTVSTLFKMLGRVLFFIKRLSIRVRFLCI